MCSVGVLVGYSFVRVSMTRYRQCATILGTRVRRTEIGCRLGPLDSPGLDAAIVGVVELGLCHCSKLPGKVDNQTD